MSGIDWRTRPNYFDPRTGEGVLLGAGWYRCFEDGTRSPIHIHPVFPEEVVHEMTASCFCSPLRDGELIVHRRVIELDEQWVEIPPDSVGA